MKRYITIDGGTTNTRIYFVSDNEIVQTVKLSIGAKDNADGSDTYKIQIKESIQKILNDNLLNSNDIECVLASGMITSEFGLCNLPHIEAPAGINELNKGLHKTLISEISEIPFVFIPGVVIKSENFEETDMMRGEETEIFGFESDKISDSLYILPGSHSKWILIDNNGKISSIKTMLTGEMIATLSSNTILKDAIDLNTNNYSVEYLQNGYNYANTHGINEALFKVRIMKNKFNLGKAELYSFFMGAVLQGEIKNAENLKIQRIIVGGKRILREITVTLLKTVTNAEIIDAGDYSETVTPLGAVKIYEYKS